MNIVFFDDDSRQHLLPLTFARPVADLRIGILTIAEKWKLLFKTEISFWTESYLQEKFPLHISNENCLINGSLLPDHSLFDAISKLGQNETLIDETRRILAKRCGSEELQNSSPDKICTSTQTVIYHKTYRAIDRTWKIFHLNDECLREDFRLITEGRKSARLSPTNRVAGTENIFVEESAKVEFSIINAMTGPVYLGHDSEIMENSVIRGPFAILEHSALKMSSKIYGATTLGPHCKVGGEVNNAVFQAYSNKAHDGFLGNAVIGEWCNLGADSNNSNLKNTYEEVRLWNYVSSGFEKTGLQFCGLIMGDHSKCGINTMFNTGTVVGFSCNLFGAGFHRNFVPSFAWGGHSGYATFDLKKAKNIATAVMKRREMVFDEKEQHLFDHLFEMTASERNF